MAPVTRVIALDTEATGLDSRASIWEIAVCPCLSTGPGEVSAVFVQPFGPYDYLRLPQTFRADYENRYDPDAALDRTEAAAWLKKIFTPDSDGTKPILVGAVPGFDDRIIRQSLPSFKPPWYYHIQDVETLAVGYLERIIRQSLPGFDPPWHYHTQDVETLAVGYLRALEQTTVLTAPERDALRRILTPPYNSTALSLAVGVEPPEPRIRHTAGGDARWAAEIWDAVHRGDPRVLSQHWQHGIWEAAAEALEETP
jgi:DNA polymerase III epsilon subunit-like protein